MLFRNEHAAAARLSIMFEVYPEMAAQKLMKSPAFFGPLKEEVPDLTNTFDPAFAQTALTIRRCLRDFREAIDDAAQFEPSQHFSKVKPRERDRDR